MPRRPFSEDRASAPPSPATGDGPPEPGYAPASSPARHTQPLPRAVPIRAQIRSVRAHPSSHARRVRSRTVHQCSAAQPHTLRPLAHRTGRRQCDVRFPQRRPMPRLPDGRGRRNPFLSCVLTAMFTGSAWAPLPSSARPPARVSEGIGGQRLIGSSKQRVCRWTPRRAHGPPAAGHGARFRSAVDRGGGASAPRRGGDSLRGAAHMRTARTRKEAGR